MKNIYIVLGLVAVVIIAGFIFLLAYPSAPTEQNNVTPVPEGEEPTGEQYVSPENGIVSPVIPLSAQSDYIIDITTAGFSPSELTINKGESVIWTNRSKAGHWITDGVGSTYPEQGTCGSKLDSCAALRLGESFKATLNVVGVWGFRDKLNPQFTGTITVK